MFRKSGICAILIGAFLSLQFGACWSDEIVSTEEPAALSDSSFRTRMCAAQALVNDKKVDEAYKLLAATQLSNLSNQDIAMIKLSMSSLARQSGRGSEADYLALEAARLSGPTSTHSQLKKITEQMEATVPLSLSKAAKYASGPNGIAKSIDNLANELELDLYALNVGKQGLLSANGNFVKSDPGKLSAIFDNMQNLHNTWRKDGHVPRIAIFMHGGLTSESAGAAIAQPHIRWLLANHIYPIFVLWNTSLRDQALEEYGIDLPIDERQISQTPNDWLPKLLSAVPLDDAIETLARGVFAKCWENMKKKALDTTNDESKVCSLDWTKPIPTGFSAGALLGARLKKYVENNSGTQVALVGHSAGSWLVAGLLQLKVMVPSTIILLAPAINTESFKKYYSDQQSKITKLVVFDLSDKFECSDTCQVGCFRYSHSLLYLISRALEDKTRPRAVGWIDSEEPLLGLYKYSNTQSCASCATPTEIVQKLKGTTIYDTPNQSPATDAKHHGDFLQDYFTMDSVLREFGLTSIESYEKYKTK